MPRHPTLPSLGLPVLLLAAGVGACAHSEPPTAPSWAPDTAFVPSAPLRLTYGGGTTPQWTPFSDRIEYAYGRDRHPDNMVAWCVGDLPSAGGARTEEFCDTDPVAADTSTLRTEWPARSSDGQVLFSAYRLNRFGAVYQRNLLLRDLRGSALNVPVLPIPFFGDGKPQGGISHPAWLDHDHLVLVGRAVNRSIKDDVNSGQEIFLVAPAQGVAGVAPVPGTTWASSLDLSAGRDTLYYTIGGDSLVYSRVLATGAVDTVFNFGGLGIAREARVRQGRLVAVVGGSVTWVPHATFGMVQYDNGGPIYAVDLPAGTPVLVSRNADRYRHPAIAPDGQHVVAEQFGDLWRISLP